MVKLTPSQEQRMWEYSDDIFEDAEYATAQERDRQYAKTMSGLTAINRKAITDMLERPSRHCLAQLERDLAQALVEQGFTEVRTPSIISKAALAKMTITEDHPLYRQLFFVDDRRVLRPMLAPNLYFVMRRLRDFTDGPVRIFEIGSCFRKESHSTNHLEEFTMLNLVELGPEGDPVDRLKEHIDLIMRTAGMEYTLTEETSDVYRTTLDVEVDGEEMASGAVGPHVRAPVNHKHQPGRGGGFGRERLIIHPPGKKNIKKAGRSLVYLNGAKID
jgi:phenylalanyl-tRNA synthetase alpha chain